MSSKAIYGNKNLLCAKVIREGVSVYRNDTSAFKGDNGCFVMGDIQERHSLCCTRVLPYACGQDHNGKERSYGVHKKYLLQSTPQYKQHGNFNPSVGLIPAQTVFEAPCLNVICQMSGPNSSLLPFYSMRPRRRRTIDLPCKAIALCGSISIALLYATSASSKRLTTQRVSPL